VFYRGAAAAFCIALCCLAVSCSRQPSSLTVERIAITRFENLGADPSNDWIGRALSQIVTRDLAGVPGIYAIPFETLHSRDAALGARPVAAPGISAERTLALAAGANRLAYGNFFERGGKLEATLMIEDPATQKMVRVVSASEDNPFEAGDELARAISRQAGPYPTRKPVALHAYVSGLESSDAVSRTSLLEQAITADPGFGPPYFLLAGLKAQGRDRMGALALLDEADARKMPELDRASIAYLAATLRDDSAAAEQALDRWSKANPDDPEVWTTLASQDFGRRRYAEAVRANQKALAIEPDNVSALNQLGYSAAYTGHLDIAMSSLERYRTLRPADANALDSMGDVNLLVGRLREAETFYLQAAKQDRNFLNGGDFFKAAMARLMSGDVEGADALDKQFVDARNAAKDPVRDYNRAQWQWISGRRKAGFSEMQAFAQNAETSGIRGAASEAYSQLAIWSVALGDRATAARLAQKAATLATPPTANLADLAGFLAQPSASPTAWGNRAAQTFPATAADQQRKLAIAYALLAGKEFAAAAEVLDPLYSAGTNAEQGLPVLLAWADLESGKTKEAAGLLRYNPIPAGTGVTPLSAFDFPRIAYLRGRLAGMSGNPEQAQSYYKLFRKLSGDEPLIWGEEAAAK
jgi:tetratricopeptide (TPR) repeat protein